MDSHYITKWKRTNSIISRHGLPMDWDSNWKTVWELIAYLPHQSRALNMKRKQLSQIDSLVVTQVPLDA